MDAITINYYDINSKYTVLNDLDIPMFFENETKAKEYLIKKGCNENIINKLVFEQCTREWKQGNSLEFIY